MTLQEELFLGVLLSYSDWDNKPNVQTIQAQDSGIMFKDLIMAMIFFFFKKQTQSYLARSVLILMQSEETMRSSLIPFCKGWK